MMKKRILAVLLAALMIAALLPTAALADGPTPQVEGSILYANGAALIFEGSANQTRIYIDNAPLGVKGTEDVRFTSFSGYAEKGNDLYGWTIYGGCKGDYTGDTKLTFLGGGVQDVYGGCFQGTLTGNTEITILGNSTVKGSVYGGSNNTSTGKGVIGNTSVTLGIEGKNVAAKVLGNVYGGGNQSSVCDNPDTTDVTEGNTVVKLLGTGAQAANVFGGGCGKYAVVEGNTSITSGGKIVSTDAGDALVFGGIYGGGYDPSDSDVADENSVFPTVLGKATITMTGGWADKIVGAGTCAAANSEILLPKLTVNEAEISITGGTVRHGIDAKERIVTTAHNVVITGGSIAGAITLGGGKKVTDGANEVYKTKLDLSALLTAAEQSKETEISTLALALSSGEYGTNSLVTDTAGDLYFYLPSGITAVASYKGANLAVNGVKADGTSVFERFSIDTTAKTIYANMNPIKLVSGNTTGYTNILYDANGDTEIKDDEMLKIGSDDPTEAGYDLSAYTVYLGFKNFEGTYSTALTMDGGVVKEIKLNETGTTTAYTVDAKINDGTILNTLNLGYTQGETNKTLEINGGSINALTTCPAPKDKSENTLYASTLTLPNAANTHVAADKLTLKKGEGETASAATYGTTGLYTTTGGLLTFWLPADMSTDETPAPVKTTYTATYTTEPAEPVYTAYVDPVGADDPYVFRQTSDPLTVSSARAVKATAGETSVTYEVTNDPVPTPITNGLKVYTYNAGSQVYTPSAVTAALTDTPTPTLTLTGAPSLAAGDYYVTVTVKDNAGTDKWESGYLKLTVADPTPEVVTTESGSTLYTNTLNVQITADAKGTYACVDIDNDTEFEETEFVMAENGTDKLNIAGYNVDATGATATVKAGTIGTLTAATVTVDGGSIKAISATTIENTDGDTLYLATVTLSGVSGKVKVTATNMDGYDVTGVYTDGGKLYFWLPVDTELKSVTAGGAYTGTLTVTTETNEATFTAPYFGGGTVTKTYTVTTGDGVSADVKKAKEGDTVTLTLEKDYVPVVTAASGETVETEGESLRFTFEMPAENVTVTAKKLEKEDPAEKYTDLDFDAWYMDAVRFCLENEYMNGVAETEFDPEGDTTREQFVTVLWRMCGSPAASKASSFSDVERDQWYTAAVDWAEEAGITNGLGDGSFGVGNTITREQIATLLYRASGSIEMAGEETGRTLADFTDAESISEYAREGMLFCVSRGIINGAGNALLPLNNTSRVQFAQIIYNISDHAE